MPHCENCGTTVNENAKYCSECGHPVKENINKNQDAENDNHKNKDDKDTHKKVEEPGEKIKNAGKKMQKLGCLLTILITIPLVLSIFLGPLGLAISIVIIVLFFIVKKN